MKIGFIGLGNMAKAMLGGMIAKGIAKPEDIIGSARTEETRKTVAEKYGITVCADNKMVASEADVLILAVKPQMFPTVIPEIKDEVNADALVISIAAGKTMTQIEEAFGRKVKLVRCMPNTPALVLEGCTGACPNANVTKEDMDALEEANATLPSLSFKAYAVQKANINNEADAWAKFNG